MSRRHLRLVSVLGAAALSAVAASPALAATVVSQSGANAVTLSVAGNGQGSGTAKATNDGSKESRSGDATPPMSVLAGQDVLNAGVLAQEATARTNGTSAACAGLAGNGGTVQVGSSRCLSPGTPVKATLGSLTKLPDVTLPSSSRALAPLDKLAARKPAATSGSPSPSSSPTQAGAGSTLAQGLGKAVPSTSSSTATPAPGTALPTDIPSGLPDLGALAGPARSAIEGAVAQLQDALGGDLGLIAGFGLVEGRCTAAPGTASGSATLANAGIKLQLPDRTVTLLDLPANPPPNTHLTTNLSRVATILLTALRTDLNESFDGAASPLSAVPAAVQEQIVNQVVTQVEPQLAPLEKNLLDVTLNKQVRPTRDSIKVRALQVDVLPAAASALGVPAAQLQIGNAACGPGARAAQAAAPAPAMPTAVSAGLESAPGTHAAADGSDHANELLLGAFAVLGTAAAGAVAWRRRSDGVRR